MIIERKKKDMNEKEENINYFILKIQKKKMKLLNNVFFNVLIIAFNSYKKNWQPKN